MNRNLPTRLLAAWTCALLMIAAPVAAQEAVEKKPAACPDCGVIENIRVIETQGAATGVGAAGGAVVGGLLGNQIGSGRANTAATVVGVGAGAFAGHRVEQGLAGKTVRHEVTVRMEDGRIQTLSFGADPGFKSGERVRVVDGKLLRP